MTINRSESLVSSAAEPVGIDESFFQVAPRVWAVIHLGIDLQALNNAKLAVDCKCEGVFIISISGRDLDVHPVAKKIKKLFPGLLRVLTQATFYVWGHK